MEMSFLIQLVIFSVVLDLEYMIRTYDFEEGRQEQYIHFFSCDIVVAASIGDCFVEKPARSDLEFEPHRRRVSTNRSGLLKTCF